MACSVPNSYDSVFLTSTLGTAHCANMYPEYKNDLPQLTEARAKIAQLVKQWLQEK